MQKTTRLQRLLAVVVAVFMAVCCLPLNAFAKEGVEEWGTVTVNYVYGGESVGTENYTGKINESDLICFHTSELKNVPTGYEIASTGDLMGANGATIDVSVNVVKEVTEYGTVTVNYVYGGESVGTENYTGEINEHDLICFHTSELKNVPTGYEIASTGDLMGANGATIDVSVNVVKEVTEYGTVTVNYVYGGESVGTENYTGEINEHDLICFHTSELKNVPTGYEIASTGDLMGANGATIDVSVNVVKEVTEYGTVTVNYVYGGEIVGSENYTGEINQYDLICFNTSELTNVPDGFEIAATGDKSGKNGETINLEVNKLETSNTVVVNIRYFEGDTFVAGGDYRFTKDATVTFGSLELPEGYELDTAVNNAESGFVAREGAKQIVHVKKGETPAGDVIMNIQFKDGDEVVAGGDYFVPAGVQNYSILTKYLPEGYMMSVSGDFLAAEGAKLEVPIEKMDNPVIMNIRFMDGDTFVAGGDYFLPAGVQNYKVLEQYLPEGYKLAVSGDFMVKEGTSLDVAVEKESKTIIMNIRFMEGDTFIAGGDYFVREGVNNYKVLDDLGYLPEGYEMDVVGDFMAKEGAKLDVPVHQIKDDSEDSSSSSDNDTNNNNSNNNDTKTVSSNNNQVVKAETPADNTAKVMPQTGLNVETPVVFGVMMVAALAGAGAYLFAIRKKLN